MNKDIAYLIGVVAGDGSLNQTKRSKGGHHYTFRIYSAGDKYLVLLNKLFEKNFEIKGKIIKDKRKNNSYHVVIKNAIIFFYFVTNGCEIGKKQRGEIPKQIKENKKYFLEYLAGLIDTDGHVKNNRIQLKQKNKKLLETIQKILNDIGLNCTNPKINYTNNKPYFYIRFDNNIPLRFKQIFLNDKN